MTGHLTRRGFVAAGASTLALPALARRALAQDRVRMGYISDFNGASLTAIANELDLWSAHDLSPELSVFTSGPIQVQALGTGDLDFAYIGPGALWLPASGRAQIISINTLSFADRVIGQAGVATAADLAGKRVGVPEGTSGDMVLGLALERAGLTTDAIDKIPMDPSTVVSAFISGQIDAAGIWYPHVETIRQRVPGLVEIAKNEDFFPANAFPSAFLARNAVADGQGDLARRVIAVLKEANDFRAENPDDAVSFTSALIGVPAAQLEAEVANSRFLTTAELAGMTEDGTVESWLQGMNDLFVRFERIADPLPPADYYRGDLYLGA